MRWIDYPRSVYSTTILLYLDPVTPPPSDECDPCWKIDSTLAFVSSTQAVLGVTTPTPSSSRLHLPALTQTTPPPPTPPLYTGSLAGTLPNPSPQYPTIPHRPPKMEFTPTRSEKSQKNRQKSRKKPHLSNQPLYVMNAPTLASIQPLPG